MKCLKAFTLPWADRGPKRQNRFNTVDLDVYQEWFELETEHWWFVGRRKLFVQLIEQTLQDQTCPPRTAPLRIADIGCGTGVNLDALSRFGTVIGVDLSDTALTFCRERRRSLLCQAPMSSLPFQSESIDLISALDVLEHGDDDRAMLSEAYRVCAPGGWAVFSVPAYPFMWGDHDVAAHHFRRYTAREIRAKVEESGFSIQRMTYLNFLLFPVSVLFRKTKNLVAGTLRRMRKSTKFRSDFRFTEPPLINPALLRIFTAEKHLLRHHDLPFGLSICCIARKPAGAQEETTVTASRFTAEEEKERNRSNQVEWTSPPT